MWNIIEHTRYNFMKIYLWRRIVPFISYIYMFVYYSTHLCNFKFLTNILNFPRKSIKRDFILITRAGNWLRTITSDQTPYTIIRRFLFELVGVISLDRHYWEVINLLFVLPILFYLSTLKNITILERKILDVRGTSFHRKRLRNIKVKLWGHLMQLQTSFVQSKNVTDAYRKSYLQMISFERGTFPGFNVLTKTSLSIQIIQAESLLRAKVSAVLDRTGSLLSRKCVHLPSVSRVYRSVTRTTSRTRWIEDRKRSERWNWRNWKHARRTDNRRKDWRKTDSWTRVLRTSQRKKLRTVSYVDRDDHAPMTTLTI